MRPARPAGNARQDRRNCRAGRSRSRPGSLTRSRRPLPAHSRSARLAAIRGRSGGCAWPPVLPGPACRGPAAPCGRPFCWGSAGRLPARQTAPGSYGRADGWRVPPSARPRRPAASVRQIGHKLLQARPVLARHHHRLADAVEPVEDAFDLAQLDPVAAQLDLEIGATKEIERAVGAPARQIAGAVEPRVLRSENGSLTKRSAVRSRRCQ